MAHHGKEGRFGLVGGKRRVPLSAQFLGFFRCTTFAFLGADAFGDVGVQDNPAAGGTRVECRRNDLAKLAGLGVLEIFLAFDLIEMPRQKFVARFNEQALGFARIDDMAHRRSDRNIGFGETSHLEILLVVDQYSRLGVENVEAVSDIVKRVLEQFALEPLSSFAQFEFAPRILAFGYVVMDNDKAASRPRIARDLHNAPVRLVADVGEAFIVN